MTRTRAFLLGVWEFRKERLPDAIYGWPIDLQLWYVAGRGFTHGFTFGVFDKHNL